MNKLREIAAVFLKLGLIGFGGPAAHIAMMEDEVVTRRKWMTREHFLDLLGATNLIPGPNSTEMAIHAGYHRAGVAGMLVAGWCFILPAVLSTGLLAWIYVEYGTIPAIEPLFNGIKPAVIAIIFAALLKLGKKAIKGRRTLIIGLATGVLLFGGVSEVIAILVGGLAGGAWLRLGRGNNDANSGAEPGDKNGSGMDQAGDNSVKKSGFALLMTPVVHASAAAGSVAVSLTQLGWSFLKIGAVLFGSGYVLIAFLEGEFVESLGWLTQQQLLDAVAMGQFTPGPVLSTATFVGYVMAGVPGAVVASLAIFLPSFIFVAALNPLIPKMRQSRLFSHILDALNAAALGLMAAVTLQLTYAVVQEWTGAVICVAAMALVIRFPKLNAAWIVLGGAACGWLLHMFV